MAELSSGTSAPTRPSAWAPGFDTSTVLNRASIAHRRKLMELAVETALEVVPHVLRSIMDIAEGSRDPKTRLLAYGMILDRALGKPAQRNEHTGEGGGPITVTIGIKESHTPAIHHTDLPITPLIGTVPNE